MLLGDKIKFAQTGREYEVNEVGVMRPGETKTNIL